AEGGVGDPAVGGDAGGQVRAGGPCAVGVGVPLRLDGVDVEAAGDVVDDVEHGLAGGVFADGQVLDLTGVGVADAVLGAGQLGLREVAGVGVEEADLDVAGIDLGGAAGVRCEGDGSAQAVAGDARGHDQEFVV